LSELRFNPTTGEWIVTATHRQERTFFPPPGFCPLCPTKDKEFETEIPLNNYDIAVFENKFPSFKPIPEEPAIEGDSLFKVDKSFGICEVVCYTDEHDLTFADLSFEQIYKLILVWKERFNDISRDKRIKFIYIFENKGKEIGVTLTHPHGQIYAFPYIPPIPAKEIRRAKKHYKKNGRCLFCDILSAELAAGTRIIEARDDFIAFLPFYARYPYEVHIYSKKHLVSISEFDEDICIDLAHILKNTAQRYDSLFGFSLPYMMVMHQLPKNGDNSIYYHFHIEFYPPYRSKDKLKYLASVESGAGTFINDSLPEEKAEELRRLVIH